MTYVEFAENVLGIELLDHQKDILNNIEKLKSEGKSFYINTYARQGKTLLNNVIQQKLGYDRGVEYGKSDGAREFAEWLCRKSRFEEIDWYGIWNRDEDNRQEFFSIDEVLAEWQKEVIR